MQPHCELFPHGADVGVRGCGATKEEAFAQVACALTSAIADLRLVTPREAIEVWCEAPDDEQLLYDWLNALVFEMNTRRMLFSRFEVHLQGKALRAVAWGEGVEPARHRPAAEVKGATYTELAVRPAPGGGWTAQCVVDV
jgi:SHS2 domain-containing protein